MQILYYFIYFLLTFCLLFPLMLEYKINQYKCLVILLCYSLLISVSVCQSTDIRNSVNMFSQLRGCQVVEGFVQIVLIDNADESDYANISFPELTEITDYLLLYRVNGLRSLGKIFPNLAVIRGNTLFENYALVAFEMLHLQVSF